MELGELSLGLAMLFQLTMVAWILMDIKKILKGRL